MAGQAWSCALADIRLAVVLVIFGMFAALPIRAEAQQMILAGRVTDAGSGKPLVGTQVTLMLNVDILGRSRTDRDGRYTLSFQRLPGVNNLAVAVDEPGYVPVQIQFQSADGRLVDPPPTIDLLAQSLAPCLGGKQRTVIVGNFRSPLGSDFAELPDRIAEALRFDLNTRLQQNWIDPSLQPVFAPCNGARPQLPELGTNLATALNADALVYGYVASAVPPFKVSTSVSDANGFVPPTTIAHDDVDLNDPERTRMSVEAHAAILASLAGGIFNKKTENCPQVISVLNVIEQLVSNPPAAVATLRARCNPHLRNTELLSNAGGGG